MRAVYAAPVVGGYDPDTVDRVGAEEVAMMLIVLCGLPGAGKSTWADKQAPAGFVVASADAIREGKDPREVMVRLETNVRNALNTGESVVVDVCALRTFERRRWLLIARHYGAETKIVFFRTPHHICRMRDDRRTHKSTIDWARAASTLNAAWREIPREGWGSVEIVK